VKCIYVAIGRRARRSRRRSETLRVNGALEYTVVVSAPALPTKRCSIPRALTGCAMGQHWMENGEHALGRYDDCPSRPRRTGRWRCCFVARPGREAYPGDVFYLHSRLLERAAKLNDEKGAGSLTALPVIETKAGDVSAYIPTQRDLRSPTVRSTCRTTSQVGRAPAVDVGISVSRVGGAAQTKAMKAVSGTLKLDSRSSASSSVRDFGSELDAVSKAQLERGARLVELLKQGLHAPMPVEEQSSRSTRARNVISTTSPPPT